MHKNSQNLGICEKNMAILAKALHPRWVVFFIFAPQLGALFLIFFTLHPGFSRAHGRTCDTYLWVSTPQALNISMANNC